jgi:hypothetical protein
VADPLECLTPETTVVWRVPELGRRYLSLHSACRALAMHRLYEREDDDTWSQLHDEDDEGREYRVPMENLDRSLRRHYGAVVRRYARLLRRATRRAQK